MSILDVAPLLLYSLGIPIPSDLEGQVPTEALEPEMLLARPVERDGPAESPAGLLSESPGGPTLDEEAEAEILKRLQALGYVE